MTVVVAGVPRGTHGAAAAAARAGPLGAGGLLGGVRGPLPPDQRWTPPR